MIRFLTVLGILVAVAAAGGLYKVKLRTAELADRVATISRDIHREEEAITVLRAEWSLLNQPDRLQALAERFLELRPMTVDQVVRVGGLSDHFERPADDLRSANPLSNSFRVGQQ